MNMDAYRQQLNELDGKIVELYIRRMEIAGAIGRYKKENGLPVKDENRERELLNRLGKQAGEEYEEGVRALFGLLIAHSCARQERILAEDRL